MRTEKETHVSPPRQGSLPTAIPPCATRKAAHQCLAHMSNDNSRLRSAIGAPRPCSDHGNRFRARSVTSLWLLDNFATCAQRHCCLDAAMLACGLFPALAPCNSGAVTCSCHRQARSGCEPPQKSSSPSARLPSVSPFALPMTADCLKSILICIAYQETHQSLVR